MNIGGYDSYAFREKGGIRILEELLEREELICTHFTKEDRTPNIDGFFELLENRDRKNIPIASFKVQIKTYEGSPDTDGAYHYSCDTKIINYAENAVSLDPVIIFLVLRNDRKVFFKYISQRYITSLKIGAQSKKVLLFTKDDELLDISVFYEQMKQIFYSQKEALISANNIMSRSERAELQKEWDRLNAIFDNDLNFIKSIVYKDVWKFGLSYRKEENIVLLGIYLVKIGSDCELIKDFDPGKFMDPKQNYTTLFQYNLPVKELVNKFISESIKAYFNKYYLPAYALPTVVLEELAFMYMDKVAMKGLNNKESRSLFGYPKDVVSISEFIHCWNSLLELSYSLYEDIPGMEHDTNAVYIDDPYKRLCQDTKVRKQFPKIFVGMTKSFRSIASH